LKKVEAKFAKAAILYNRYVDFSSEFLENPELCDMSCAHRCVDNRDKLGVVLDCVSNYCLCPLSQQVINKLPEWGIEIGNPLYEDSDTPASILHETVDTISFASVKRDENNCNVTCTA